MSDQFTVTNHLSCPNAVYTKSAEEVSATAYIICIILLIHWLCYGYLIKNRVLIIAEDLGLIGAILVLTGIFVYG